ncbi:MAG: hypothetical protein SVN78_07635 [Deferribacterota bacterium]|nr:hypothetical protein [Deferribacterota bacterium]
MKKIIFLTLLIFLNACSKELPKEDVDIKTTKRHIDIPFVDIKEAEKYIDILGLSYNVLPINRTSKFYILPVRLELLGEIKYVKSYENIIKNYIILNALGYIVEDKELADYYIVISIKESVRTYLSENYSLVEFSVFTKLDVPVFHISVKVRSDRDEGFYYHPSKPAKSPRSLSINGIIYILNKYFIKIFQGGKNA